MNSIEKATDLFHVWAPDLTEEVLKRAQKGVEGAVKLGDTLLDNIQLPIITDDEQVKKYIEKFELYKPKNMIRFFVEASFASIEQIGESVNKLRRDDLSKTISSVNAAYNIVIYGIDNRNFDKLERAQDNLMVSTEDLKEKLKNYVQDIRNVDNRSAWHFFIKSRLSVDEINNINQCAKNALAALFRTMELQILIKNQLDQQNPKEKHNIDNSIIVPFQKFVEEYLLKNDTIGLMHAYDIKKEEEFWLKIPEKLNKFDAVQKQLEDFSSQFDEDEEIDFN